MIDISFRPIGTISSPHTSAAGMPIQPRGATGVAGRVEVFPEFAEGLKDLSGFSHVFLLYHHWDVESTGWLGQRRHRAGTTPSDERFTQD